MELTGDDDGVAKWWRRRDADADEHEEIDADADADEEVDADAKRWNKMVFEEEEDARRNAEDWRRIEEERKWIIDLIGYFKPDPTRTELNRVGSVQ